MLLMLLTNLFLDLLPFDAEGRIGEHVVELLVGVAVAGEGVSRDNVGDILPFDEHVGFADRVAFVVQLLAGHRQAGLGVEVREVLARDRQHAACPRSGVVDRAHDAGLGQHVVILDKEEVDHEADDFARREVLSGRLVREFREFADQLFEDVAHLRVADFVRVEVDVRELFGDLIEQLRFRQPVNLGEEVEAFEDVADGWRKRLDVGEEVFADVVLVADQLPHIHRRGVAEARSRFPEQKRFRRPARLLLGSALSQDGFLGGLQDAIQAAQHGEGQDDFAVIRLLVVAAQEVRHGPDE